MDNLTAHIIATAIIAGANIQHAIDNDDDFALIKWRQTAALYLPLAKRETSRARMIAHGLDPYRPKFYGHNPLTGVPCQVVFNEPSPGRNSLMNWNPLMQKWMYSNDAGLTWRPVEFMDYIEKIDCLCDEPKYNER